MYQNLLSDYRSLEHQEEFDETFISICGYPHYERVASNILQFFIDNKREHNLGNLFIEELLSLVGWTIDDFGEDISVETEIQTKKGNYIDIMITGEDKAIVIENKIYAWLYNDLDDYFKFANTKKSSIKGIVLSLNKQEKYDNRYEYITYDVLINKIKSKLGYYAINANSKYLTFLFDFLSNIENLKRGINMDMEFIKFIRKNEEEVKEINRKLKEVHDQFRNKVKLVNNLVLEMINDSSIKQWPWRELPDLFDVAVTDIQIGVLRIAIHAEIGTNGWRFCIFERGDNIDLEKLQKVIGIEGNIEEDKRLYFEKEYGIEEAESTIASHIVEIINIIKSKDLTTIST